MTPLASSAKFAANPGVDPLMMRVIGFSSLPPLARLARVVKKSAVAAAPTPANNKLFSRSQKACFSEPFTGFVVVTNGAGVSGAAGVAAGTASKNTELGAMGNAEADAISTGWACVGLVTMLGNTGADLSCPKMKPDSASTSAELVIEIRSVSRNECLHMTLVVPQPSSSSTCTVASLPNLV